MHLVGPAARAATLAYDAEQGVHEVPEYHRVMPVGRRNAERQRQALPVDDEMPLVAELASVCRLGQVYEPPGG